MVWLVDQLPEGGLRAGQLVFSGGVTAPVPVVAGGSVAFDRSEPCRNRRRGAADGVRTRSATWLAAFTGALDGTIEREFRTVPGFSNQRDREIEHRRHLTPPTID